MRNSIAPQRLDVDVAAALRAICSTGKGCCWYCDARLPAEAEAVAGGWDVQRLNDHAVASIILVCPFCRRLTPEQEAAPLKLMPIASIAARRRPRTRRAAQPL